jgi:hypothetical protein
LTLAASGVLLPFITGGPVGTTALVEIASPVGPNDIPPVHLIFYNSTCTRAQSTQVELTTNDIAHIDPANSVGFNVNGLVAVAAVGVDPIFGLPDPFRLGPLSNPIHTRVYEFNPADGRSRVLEPITVDTAEFGAFDGYYEKLWSPLRSGMTFFAPQETDDVKTQITLICPRASIQGDTLAAFGDSANQPGFGLSSDGFPLIFPRFFSATGAGLQIFGQVYDTEESPIADVNFRCDCLTPDFSVVGVAIPGTYSGLSAADGTYTEMVVTQSDPPAQPNTSAGSFTGYKASFTVGSPLNNFFSRMSNANRISLQGLINNER